MRPTSCSVHARFLVCQQAFAAAPPDFKCNLRDQPSPGPPMHSSQRAPTRLRHKANRSRRVVRSSCLCSTCSSAAVSNPLLRNAQASPFFGHCSLDWVTMTWATRRLHPNHHSSASWGASSLIMSSIRRIVMAASVAKRSMLTCERRWAVCEAQTSAALAPSARRREWARRGRKARSAMQDRRAQARRTHMPWGGGEAIVGAAVYWSAVAPWTWRARGRRPRRCRGSLR